jgi:hypothetical protein
MVIGTLSPTRVGAGAPVGLTVFNHAHTPFVYA